MYSCIIVLLYLCTCVFCTLVLLYACTLVLLYSCTVELLYPFNLVLLYSCTLDFLYGSSGNYYITICNSVAFSSPISKVLHSPYSRVIPHILSTSLQPFRPVCPPALQPSSPRCPATCSQGWPGLYSDVGGMEFMNVSCSKSAALTPPD